MMNYYYNKDWYLRMTIHDRINEKAVEGLKRLSHEIYTHQKYNNIYKIPKKYQVKDIYGSKISVKH